MRDLGPIAAGAGLSLTVALFWLVIDWGRIGWRLRLIGCTLESWHRRLGRTPMSHRTDTVYGIGWRIVTDHRIEVSSTQVYSNGTTQIWLKRRPAA